MEESRHLLFAKKKEKKENKSKRGHQPSFSARRIAESSARRNDVIPFQPSQKNVYSEGTPPSEKHNNFVEGEILSPLSRRKEWQAGY